MHEALRDSLDYLDQNNIVNFTDFDSDGDGKIDAITFMHSGYAAEWMAPDQYGGTYRNRIWSHKWMIWGNSYGDYVGPWESKDGVVVYDYHISPALWGVSGTEIGHIGVIAHESGHFMGKCSCVPYMPRNLWSRRPLTSCWLKLQIWMTSMIPMVAATVLGTTASCHRPGDGTNRKNHQAR